MKLILFIFHSFFVFSQSIEELLPLRKEFLRSGKGQQVPYLKWADSSLDSALKGRSCAEQSVQIFNRSLTEIEKMEEEWIWEVENTEDFNELLLSWNALRTEGIQNAIYVSLKQDGKWSPWLYYADWGDMGRMLGHETFPESCAITSRGVAKPIKGKCDGFRCKISAKGRGDLRGMHHLAVCLTDLSTFQPSFSIPEVESVELKDFPGLSWISVRSSRYLDFSMPISALCAAKFLKKQPLEPSQFIENILETYSDCYEEWEINAAECFHFLENSYLVSVQHLNDFSSLYSYLKNNTPVLAQIKGSIAGGPRPYRNPHVVCVIGYLAEEKKVLCMDCGFLRDHATIVKYPLMDFLKAWEKCFNMVIVFSKENFP